jgi:hypothetical protein
MLKGWKLETSEKLGGLNILSFEQLGGGERMTTLYQMAM